MPLPKQTVHYPFVAGRDAKPDGKHLQMPKLLDLQNGVFDEPGQIEPRPGWTNLGTNTTSKDDSTNYEIIDEAYVAAVVRDELLVAACQRDGADNDKTYYKDGSKLFSYSEAQGRWSDVGEISPYMWSVHDVSRSGYRWGADVAVCGNYIVVANVRSNCSDLYLNVLVLDKSTKAVLHDIEESTNYPLLGTGARLAVVGTKVGIFYIDSASADIFWGTFDTAAPDTAPSFAQLISTTCTSFDVTVSNSLFVVAFRSANPFLTIDTYNTTGVKQNSGSHTTGGDPGDICIEVDGSGNGAVVVSYSQGTYISVLALDIDMTYATGFSAPVNVYNVGTSWAVDNTAIMYDPGVSSASCWRIWFTARHTTTGFIIGSVAVETADGSIEGSAYIFGHTAYDANLYPRMVIASKCFVGAGGRVSVMARLVSGYQPTYFILSMHDYDGSETVEVDAKLLANRAPWQGAYCNLTSVVNSGGTLYAAMYAGDIERFDIWTLWSVVLAEIDIDTSAFMTPVVSGNDLTIGAGVLHGYDGSLCELGFHIYPEEIHSIATAASGGSIEAGTYYYKIIYEWHDSFGQVHRSAPSAASATHASGSANKATITVMRSSMIDTKKLENCKVVLYRTEAGLSTYYRVDDEYLTKTGTTTITIVDTSADSSITSNEQLYTGGNYLENDGPPAGNVAAISGDRMWIAPYDDEGLLWYSKVKAVNIGYEFNAGATVRHELGGKVTALADMDGKLIIFKRTSIFYLYGSGPNNMGQGVFSPIQSVSVDVGCVSQRSVVACSMGIVFQSVKGIKLLTRTLEIVDLGMPVEDYDANDVYCATLLEDQQQIRFGTSSNVVLMYDYLVKQWSVFTNHTNIIDAVNYDGGYVWLSSNAVAHQEDSSAQDNGSDISLVVETSWIKLAGLQGLKRVYWLQFLGEFTGSGTLDIDVYYDYNDTAVDEHSESYTTEDPFPIRVRVSRQKCQSVKVKLTGADFKISGMSIIYGVKGRLALLSAADTV